MDRHWAATALPVMAGLGIYIFLGGIEDALLDVLWLWRGKRRPWPGPAGERREKRIAILVPLWKEADVIGAMLEHNLASIRYGNYEILAGVYANDEETREAVERVAARRPQVRAAVVPHDGPTSKADCLNWVFQRLVEQEMQGCPAAEVILVHDAEDLIHPDSLALVNGLIEQADMVQVPVLALATPPHELTHGVYCDDFAESQTKDLATRAWLGAFLPGCGVGTAFRREALERLAEAHSNRLFDPLSLTEDYDNGLRLHQLGCRQMFVPLQWSGVQPLATREYFPRTLRAAIRQRTRWVTGNCLQGWQRHGWGLGMRRPWLQAWFFWRDRKVLWGSWIGLATNGMFLWALAGWAAAAASGSAWRLGEAVAGHPWLGPLLAANLVLCCQRLTMRIYCTGRIYGWALAAGAPLRMVWGNLINAAASARAVWQFSRSLWTGKPLRWLKTEHCYPSLASLQAAASPAGLALAAAAGAPGTPAMAVANGSRWSSPISAGSLNGHEALAAAETRDGWQPHPVSSPPALLTAASRRLLRALPASLCDEIGVIPLRMNKGCLEVAVSGEVAPAHKRRLIQRAGVPVRFVQVPAGAVRRLARERDAPPRPMGPWLAVPESASHWRHPPADAPRQ